MAFLSTEAMRYIMSKRVLSFLDFQWHSADSEIGGSGEHSNTVGTRADTENIEKTMNIFS